MSTTVPPTLGGYAPPAGPPVARPAELPARARALPASWPLAATVFAATSIVVGLIWDIAWHITIGRDTFWTPAHMGIYLGGTLAGVANGALVLHTTFGGTPAERAAARGRTVGFWGFRGPLGAFVSVWGAGAMLTSAPFDDWWHAAYGLDVEILSPPHTVLLLGMAFVLGGAAVTALQAQNAAEERGDPRARRYRGAFAYTLGLLVTMGALAVWSDTRPHMARTAHYYQFAAVPFAAVFAAAARALRVRWPATTAALVYMGVFLAMGWLLEPWPATPKLGPIRQDITHMQSLGFPLLLAAPAFAVDLLARATSRRRAAVQALALGLGVPRRDGRGALVVRGLPAVAGRPQRGVPRRPLPVLAAEDERVVPGAVLVARVDARGVLARHGVGGARRGARGARGARVGRVDARGAAVSAAMVRRAAGACGGRRAPSWRRRGRSSSPPRRSRPPPPPRRTSAPPTPCTTGWRGRTPCAWWCACRG
jgi:hypothetical protein